LALTCSGRQRLMRSSRSLTRPVINSDNTAKMMRPANTTSTLKPLAARTITTPSPSCAPKNSATTTPRMARPIASRNPTTMTGDFWSWHSTSECYGVEIRPRGGLRCRPESRNRLSLGRRSIRPRTAVLWRKRHKRFGKQALPIGRK
jgi:hypothetical protein